MRLEKLPYDVAQRLGYYVYIYTDPRTGKPFYVGKGQGSRVLAHLDVQNESRKVQILRELAENNLEPQIDILTHALPDEQTAFRIEAAVIDALRLAELTNEVRGWGAHHGRAPLQELIFSYGATPVKISDPAILIRINRLYEPGMDAHKLYEATRGSWKVSKRRERARLAMAVFEGVVRAVYEIESWHAAGSTTYTTRNVEALRRPGRFEFTGRQAAPEYVHKYLGKSVLADLGKGSQNPIMYVNC